MAALFDQKLIVCYLITLKLTETIEAYLRKLQEKPIARPIHLSLHKSNPVLKPLPMPQPPSLGPAQSALRPQPPPPPPPPPPAPWPVLPPLPPRSRVRPRQPPAPLVSSSSPSPPQRSRRQKQIARSVHLRLHKSIHLSLKKSYPVHKPLTNHQINLCSLPCAVLPRSTPPPPPPPPPVTPPPAPQPPSSPPCLLPPPDSQWISSIFEKFKEARQYEASSLWETQSIYRVPKSLRDIDQTAYTPKIVSLGPYHRGCYRSMDRHKWRSLYHALGRTNQDVRLYFKAAHSLEDRARSCYEAPISISSDEFVESLVLDSIFALELFRGVAGEGFQALGYSPKDPVFAVRGFMPSLQHDMIMLENQLPLFVLDRMLALQLGHDPSSSYRVAPLALRFFEPLKPTYDLLPLTASSDPPYEADSSRALHCLDVFRLSLAAPFPRPSSVVVPLPIADDRPISNEQRQQLIHCVADLRKAGIKFRRGTSDRFWDIKFKDGILYIPPLLIHDGTKSLFLNLIAFEQCHLECGNSITAYVTFMDNLINTEVDVGYLHDKKIIEHWLGNDGEVAAMFNRLCQEVALNRYECYLSELSKQVNHYYHNKWNNWKASFAQKYFSNPWTFISLIAAVFLLLLTAAQTFYTVYPYYKPK